MELYIMRHGETHWNAEGLVQGSSDIALTPYGISLAEETAQGMDEKGIHFDQVFSSPYIRALKTAECIAKKDQLTPIVDERIREMNFGKYEGQSLSGLIQIDENFNHCFRQPSLYVPDETGESFEEVQGRIREFLEKEILPLEQKKDCVLIVCHGAVIRTFFQIINNAPLDDFWKVRQPNCCVNHFRVTDGEITMIEPNMLFYKPKEESEEEKKKKAGVL